MGNRPVTTSVRAVWIVAALCVWTIAAQSRAAEPQKDARLRPLVGAIRWDAWYGGDGEVEHAVERTLGPQKYHDRLPFFARVLGSDRVQIRGDAPAVMEREIAYAKQARLDYWAFVWYDPDDPMSLALRHYLASPHRQDIRFALVTEADRWGSPATFPSRKAQLVEMVGRPTYQTVLGDRPLLYLGFIDDDQLRTTWGSRQAFRDAIDAFRRAVIQSGRKNPCIVCMEFSAQRASELARSLGLDAISAYACPGGSKAGESFAESRKKVRAFWQSCRATGMPQVPLVSFGWDPRPRVDNPVPWTKYTDSNHYRAAEPQQLAEHLKEALDWTAAHPAATAPNTVLVYAWNENDEGGWLIPTLKPDGTADTAHVEAMGRMLGDWQTAR